MFVTKWRKIIGYCLAATLLQSLLSVALSTAWAAPAQKGKAKQTSKKAPAVKKSASSKTKSATTTTPNLKTKTPIKVSPTSTPSTQTPTAQVAQPPKDSSRSELGMKLDQDFEKLPTFINSKSLALDSEKRIFTYTGKVEVKHGDMTITSDILEGYYDDKNQIQKMVARSNVSITKGESMHGTAQRAVYEKASNTVTLTENPSLEQNGSILSADIISVDLNTNKSTAEGEVRVKLIGKEGDEGKSLLGLPKR